jgi:hypothetical protein
MYALGHGRYAIDLAWVVVSIDADRPAINAGRSHFAPHPHHVVIPADQSGQIPTRVLRLSHSAKKNRSALLGGATGATECATVAFGGMRSGVGGARHHPTPRFAPRAFLATFALNPLHPSEQTWFALLKDLTSQADMREPRLLDHLIGRALIP